MTENPFVHCHNHTHFSIGDGLTSPKELVTKAKELGHKAIVSSDHGNANSIYECFKEGKAIDIKILCGVEAYLGAQLKTEDEEGKVKRDTSYHSVLLAKDDIGYKQICKLLYKANKETYYYKPIILFDDFFAIEPGHITLSTACIGGIINRFFLNDQDEEAYKMAIRLRDFLKDDLYFELILNELNEQKVCNEKLLKLGKEIGHEKFILTNDTHYPNKEDIKTQDALKLIIRKNTIKEIEANPEKSPFATVRKSFICSRQDFHDFNKEFGYNYDASKIDQWLDLTNEVADKCNFVFDTESKKFPKIKVPEKYKDVDDYFKQLCVKGLTEKIESKEIPREKTKEYAERLKHEMRVICTAGYADYFLIFYDIFQFVRESEIWVGPARGSAGGCLVSYVLGITKIDPIRHDLMFERFIASSIVKVEEPDDCGDGENGDQIIGTVPTQKTVKKTKTCVIVERTSIPDIDSDFDSDRKPEIEDYLRIKYGEDSVIHVPTYSEFHVKGVLRDLVRVFDRDVGLLNKMTKELEEDVPVQYGDDIKKYLESLGENSSDVKEFVEKNSDILPLANSLYRKIRHLGKHAAGVVIFDGPIYDYIPVQRTGGEVIASFNEGTVKKFLSDLKILKLDILGLDTVSIIKDTVNLIKEKRNVDLTEKIYDLDLGDENIYRTVRDYENAGIFQMDGFGINKLARDVNPQSFEDVVAISCLYRPAALQGGLAYQYAESKNDPTKKVDVPKIFQKYVTKTYGVILYQEQTMQCVAEILGITLGEADKWRKPFERGFRGEWVDGLDLQNLDKERQERPKLDEFIKLYDEKIKITHPELNAQEKQETLLYLLNFTGYSFNRAHGLSYGYITVMCLYLKCYFPSEFFVSLISRCDDDDKRKKYIMSGKKKGLTILPFSVTKSKFICQPEGDNGLRLGLSMCKGLGIKAWEELEPRQKLITDAKSFYNQSWSKMNRKCVKVLASVGAFDEWGYTRKSILEFVEQYADNIKAAKKNKRSDEEIWAVLEKADGKNKELNKKEFLKLDKEFLGFSMQQILDDSFAQIQEVFKRNKIGTFADMATKRSGTVGGFVESIVDKKTKTGKLYHEIVLNDGSQSNRVRIWPWNLDSSFDSSQLGENSVVVLDLLYEDKFGFSTMRNGMFKIIQN
jgi:DNA polymerase-3 subunit alpha